MIQQTQAIQRQPLPPCLAAPPAIKDTKPPSSWPVLVSSALLGGAISYAAITWALDAQTVRELMTLAPLHMAMLLVGGVLMVWLALLVHEAGHLLGGWFGGLRPFLLLAGPLRMEFEAGAFKLRWNRDASTWGGLAVALPKGPDVGRRAVALMVVGGPAASLLLAVAAWATPGPGILSGSLLGILCLISGAIGVGTLLPMSMGGYVSDGGQLLQWLRGSPDSAHRLKLAAVLGLNQAGRRPRDWPLAPLKEVAEQAHAPQLRTSALLLWAQCEDDRNPQTVMDDQHPAYRAFVALARDLHAGGLVQLPTAFRSDIMLPISIFLAQRLGQASAARDWLQAYPGAQSSRWEQHHAKAALAWAQGDTSQAQAEALRALEGLPVEGSDGVKAMARERLQGYVERTHR